MGNYFVRRLLLIFPTFIGITVVVFVITRFVPGGPVEQAIMNRMLAQGGKNSVQNTQPLSEEKIAELNAYYGFDQPVWKSYLIWLGKLVRGDLGRSTKYNDPVLGMIVSRFPISLRFGIISLILTYSICIPMGLRKALKHRQTYDNVTSILIFIGYALPSFVVAIILLSFFSFRLGWFPSGDMYSRGYENFNFFQKIWDNVKHMFLPMIAYVLASFAGLTIVMKNNLMENMAADYVKTAVAKGRTFKDAMWKHAFRNSMIPIAAGFGNVISVFFSGAFLIEKIFNIQGMGLLGFRAIEERDYPVVLGTLAMTATVTLVGNILSDFILSLVDPRIKLGR